MTSSYLDLADKIENQLTEIERVVERTGQAMSLAKSRPNEQDFFLDSVALNLHDFYAGLERLFEGVGKTVDQHVPSDSHWHQKLLKQMQTEIPQVRPPILSEEGVTLLSEFLRFRHVVRNVYAYNLDPERLDLLVQKMRPTFQLIRSSLNDFATFLKEVSKPE